MAGEETHEQEPQEVLVSPLEGQGGGQGDSPQQVSQPGLLEHLYSLGAEVVLSITGAEKLVYTITFPGRNEPLSLPLPPGNYVICRLPEVAFPEPGLRPVVNPRKA